MVNSRSPGSDVRMVAYLAVGLVVVLLGVMLTRLAWACFLTAGVSLRELARGDR
jgi:ABC-type Na+ efflux pump permease subunit